MVAGAVINTSSLRWPHKWKSIKGHVWTMWRPQSCGNQPISKQWLKKLHCFPHSMWMYVVVLELGINISAFKKGDEISDDLSTCFSNNRRVEEDWANDSLIRHGILCTHFQWIMAYFRVQVLGWPYSIILRVDVTAQMKPRIVGENVLENTMMIVIEVTKLVTEV